MTLRDQIMQADDLPRKAVPTPEWPGTDGEVFAQCLSGKQRDQWEVFMTNQSEADPEGEEDERRYKANTTNIRATMVVMGACDKDGDDIFSQSDVVQLGLKSGAVLDRLYDAIREVSGMGKDEKEKNPTSARGNDSPTDSPSPGDVQSENSSDD